MSGTLQKLSVAQIVDVSIVLAPLAAQTRDFGNLLILGDSAVIDLGERRRTYSTIDAVAADFGTTANEYLAALAYFSQSPRPVDVSIGRWAKAAAAGRLVGAPLSAAQQALAGFTVITSGGFTINIDGTARALVGINLSGAANLNAVAALVQTALSTWATCVWNAIRRRFEITSTTTGAASTVSSVAIATPLSTLLGISAAQSPRAAAGGAAETLTACASFFSNAFTDWYGLAVAATLLTNDNDILPLAAFIEAAEPSRILAFTTQSATVLDALDTTDIASQLRALSTRRTFVQYSSTSRFAAISAFGRAFTTNFNGSLTAMTLKFKQSPGVIPEYLSQSQAQALRGKNCNVFVAYNNDTSILQEGVMMSGAFFDEVHNLDWLQNAVQTDIYNTLYTSGTKIPQTDAGMNELVTVMENRLEGAVANGVLAPGVWNASGFGQLRRGDTLSKGYYIYAPPVASQIQSDREARKSVAFQIAAKMAGAIHSVDIIVNVNR